MSMNYAKSGLPGIMRQRIRRRYLSVFLSKPGHKERNFTVHSLVARAFIGPRPGGMTSKHKDGIKENNRVENLEYVTPSRNSKHSFEIGLQCNKGIQHSQHKLTDDQIRDIRARNLGGESQISIAKSLGVTQSAIHLVVRRKRWDHVH